MVNLKKTATGAAIAGALALTGLGAAGGVANADAPSAHSAVTMSTLNGFALDDWGYGPGYGYGYGPGYGPGWGGWGGGPGYGYGYGGACAWIPPFVSQWIPPVACGG